jgi:hypothetical protein
VPTNGPRRPIITFNCRWWGTLDLKDNVGALPEFIRRIWGKPWLSHYIHTGVYERHLSHVDTCHLVGAVHLYTRIEHLSGPHPRLANVTQVKCSNSVCLRIMTRLLAFPRLVHAWQANNLCVWTRSVIRNVEWPSKLVMVHDYEDQEHIVHEYDSLPNKPVVETVSPGSLHSAQLLAHVSNVTSLGNAAYQSNFKLRAQTWVRQAHHPDGMSLVSFLAPKSNVINPSATNTSANKKKAQGVRLIVCHPVYGSVKA